MNNYIIMTDSCCDLSQETLLKWGIESVSLNFRNIHDNIICSDWDMPASDFYCAMRNGTVFQTSTVNPDEYRTAFRNLLDRGNDILYISFSSGLSGTCRMAECAARELAEEYPKRKLHVFDSLCASAGQGLLVYLAVKKKSEGADFETLVRYISEIAPKICHWFTVDDLIYLKRGGRINAASAFAATILDIKPIMHMDETGHLEAVSKIRGRKHSIRVLAEKYQSLAENPEDGEYFISHGDCLEDALLLENIIRQKFGIKASCITDVGSVIGAHSGPGTLALFFIGKQR